MLREHEHERCGWEYSYDYKECEAYYTACGQQWQFFCGTAKENGFEYCPFCGRKIEEVYREGD